MKKSSFDFEVFQWNSIYNFIWLTKRERGDKILQELLKKYGVLFKEHFNSAWPPGSNVDLDIVIENEGKPPHR